MVQWVGFYWLLLSVRTHLNSPVQLKVHWRVTEVKGKMVTGKWEVYAMARLVPNHVDSLPHYIVTDNLIFLMEGRRIGRRVGCVCWKGKSSEQESTHL